MGSTIISRKGILGLKNDKQESKAITIETRAVKELGKLLIIIK
jgi:hypothetical protein